MQQIGFTMLRLISFMLLLFVLCADPVHSYGWGLTGHRVIAEIAENHLSKKTKRKLKELLGNQKMAYWSNWADFIKSDPSPELQETSSWHFINTEGNLSYEEFVDQLFQSPDNNLYKAYLKVKENLKNKSLSLEDRRQNLYFLIHLLGDGHQPMHVSREEDLGGNKIDVTWFGRRSNIHRVWDSDLIDHEQYSYVEYAGILDVYKTKYYKKYTETSFESWLYESHELANQIYSGVEKDNKLSYSYVYEYKYIMEERLLKAGLRLAKELNEIFG